MNFTMEFYKYDSLNWLSSATSRGIIPQIINYSGSPEFLISKNPWNFTHPVIPEPKKKINHSLANNLILRPATKRRTVS